MIAKIDPLFTSNETFFCIIREPYEIVRFRTEMTDDDSVLSIAASSVVLVMYYPSG
ncbi:hypothetical protein B932_1786 [Gluconobacter oxydans H24]|nr:hypothetical protein B932_1786 [Gluconobacter oxydans H24]